jgi:SAM-dependent methyltransferase
MNATPKQTRGFSVLKSAHGHLVFDRRVRVLAASLAAAIPPNSALLDIGCGDGTIGSMVATAAQTSQVAGIEIAERPACRIPCRVFDGIHIPFPDRSFDVAMFVDVLHHANSIQEVLSEAARVSRRFILIKDHLAENQLDFRILQFMDWVGNRPHGVVLPYNYQSKAQWMSYFAGCRLKVSSWTSELPLYPAPFNIFFGRNLHFIALLEKEEF